MLNKTAYEILPFAYIGAGALSLALLDSPLRAVPGMALLAAGTLVMLWRWSAREHARKRLRASKACRESRRRYG